MADKRIHLALLLSAAIAVGVALPAWACVPQPLVTIEPAASGPAGSEVTVEGVALNGRVEVRWNAIDGPLLATGSGPEISAAVAIPSVSPGLYSVVVVEREPGGGLGSSGRAAFLVTGDGGPGGGVAEEEAAGPGDSGDAVPDQRSASVPVGGLVAGGAGLFAVGVLAGVALRGRGRQREGRRPATS